MARIFVIRASLVPEHGLVTAQPFAQGRVPGLPGGGDGGPP